MARKSSMYPHPVRTQLNSLELYDHNSTCNHAVAITLEIAAILYMYFFNKPCKNNYGVRGEHSTL